MKKRAFKFIGLFISLAGLFLMIRNLSITGFTIAKTINNATSYFLPLVLFMGGILIAMSGDSLQAWLERKEKEQASPSLEGKLQTKAEEKELSKRYSGNLPWYKRLGKSKVEIIPQNGKKYEKDSGYQTEDFYAPSYKIKRELERRTEEEQQKQRGYASYRKSRGIIGEELRKIKNRTVETGEDVITPDSIDRFMGSLKKTTDNLGIAFNSERYSALLKKNLPGYHQANLDAAGKELIKYLESNSERVNIREMGNKLQRVMDFVKLTGVERSQIPGVPLSQEEAARYYMEHARTMSISDFEKQHGKTIISAVPYKSKREFLNNHDLTDPRSMSYLDFLKANLNENIMLSASAVSKDSDSKEFFSPIGLVMGDGKIYDASSEDITSQANHGSRIAMGNIGASRDRPVEERAVEASRSSNGFWNEYIIGKHSPRGIYFIREGIESLKNRRSNAYAENIPPEETIRNLANFAKEQGISLYEFKPGKGFVEISDVNSYLKPIGKSKGKKAQ